MPKKEEKGCSSTADRKALRDARIHQIAAGLVDGMTYAQIAADMGVTKGIVAGILKRHGDAVVVRMNQIKRDIAQAEAMAHEPLWTDADEAEALDAYEAFIAPLPKPIDTVRPIHSREYVDTLLTQRGIDRILIMSENGRSVQDIGAFLNTPVLVVESVIVDAGLVPLWHNEVDRALAVLRNQHVPFTPLPNELAFPEVVEEIPAPAPPVPPVSLLALAARRIAGFVCQMRSVGVRLVGAAS